jgi:hypothetical protein
VGRRKAEVSALAISALAEDEPPVASATSWLALASVSDCRSASVVVHHDRVPSVAVTSLGGRLKLLVGPHCDNRLREITRLLDIDLSGSRTDPYALSAQRFLRSFFT